MRIASASRSIACLIVACLAGPYLLFPHAALADEVTLQSGGIVHGHVVAAHAKTMEIKTASGAVIVLKAYAVKHVQRDPAGTQKAAVVKKPRLTPQEQAWMAKVRSMVARLLGDSPEQSRRAKAQLLGIQDPDALPALARYLQHNRNEEARRLYVLILRNMPGAKAVYYLVGQSLFDPSDAVRDGARKAIGSERADSARALYINALKSGNVNLASRAARGIQEIGDPNGVAVPYLINALVFVDTRVITLPGYQEWGWTSPTTLRLPLKVVSAGFGGSDGGSGGLAPGAGGYTLRVPAPPAGQASAPAQQPIQWQLLPGDYVPARSVAVPLKDVNPAVLDALVQITDHKYSGNQYSPDGWRTWWKSQTALRDRKKPDHVLPAPH
jgi:HEAT repeats